MISIKHVGGPAAVRIQRTVSEVAAPMPKTTMLKATMIVERAGRVVKSRTIYATNQEGLIRGCHSLHLRGFRLAV